MSMSDEEAVCAVSEAPRRGVTTAGVLLGLHLLAMVAGGILLQAGWRVFPLTCGWTAAAKLSVVAAVALGMAAGGIFVGRWVGRVGAPPMGVLAVLQAAFGAAALISPFIFAVGRALYFSLWPGLGSLGPTGGILRFISALTLFALPAALFAGTMVALGCLLQTDRDGGSTGRALDLGLSFAGIALGLAAGGTVILPALGTRGATLVGAALTGLAAAGTVLVRQSGLDGRGRIAAILQLDGVDDVAGVEAGEGGRPAPSGAAGISAVAVFLFGLTGWAYLLLWGRTLGFIVGPTEPGSATVWSVALLGLALGGLLHALLSGWIRRPEVLLVALTVAAGITVQLTSFFLVNRASLLYLGLTPLMAGAGPSQLAAIVTAAFLILPVALLLGIALPILPSAATGKGRDAMFAGGGTIPLLCLGAVAAELSFRMFIVPMPAFGLRRSIALAAAVGLLSAILLLGGVSFRKQGQRTTIVIVLLGLMIVVGNFPASWDLNAIASGPYRYGRRGMARFGSASDFLASRRGTAPIFYREGREASVLVEREVTAESDETVIPGMRLTVDGKVVAGTGPGITTQVLTGQIPILVHGPTERVLLIDLASGMTAGTILSHPVESLTVFEREPAILEAARHFAAFNDDSLADPRVSVMHDTARNRLRVDPTSYDVIILSATEPWLPHSAALSTREGYEVLRSRLRRGGLLAQRISAAAAPRGALETIARTFAAVFDSTLLFRISSEDLLLLGSEEALAIDIGWLRNVTESDERVALEVARVVALGPDDIIMAFRLGGDALRRLVGEGPLNVDDRASVQVAATRALTVHRNEEFLFEVDSASPEVVPFLANYGALPEERVSYLYRLAKSYLGVSGDMLRAASIAEELEAMGEKVKAHWVRGESLFQKADIDGALEKWEAALELDPGDLDSLFSLGTFHLDNRDYHAAERYLSRAARRHDDTAVVRYHRGRNLYYLGRYAEAISEFEAARRFARQRESYPLIDYLAGVAAARLRRNEEAAAALEAYLAWAYEQKVLTLVEVDAHLKLADVYEEQGKRMEAHEQRQKGELLRIDIASYARRQRGATPGTTTSPLPGSKFPAVKPEEELLLETAEPPGAGTPPPTDPPETDGS